MEKLPYFDSSSYFVAHQSVAVVPMSLQTDLAPHSHNYHELVIITKGKGTHKSMGGEFSLGAGDVFLIPPNIEHAYESTADLGLYNILYLPDRLEKLNCDAAELPGWFMLLTAEPAFRKKTGFTDHLRLDPRALATVISKIEALTDELANKSPGWRLASTSLFYDLLVFLCRKANIPTLEKPSPAAGLAKVLSILESQFEQNILLSDLTLASGLTERTLLRLFKGLTGVTPMQYLINLRLEYARRLLKETDFSVSRIALEAGFSEGNYFSRIFKAKYQMTPKAFR